MFLAIFKLKERDLRLFETPESKIRQSLDPFDCADRYGAVQTNEFKIFQALTFNTGTSEQEKTPHICRDSGLILASWVRLDNRRELAEKLAINKGDLSSTTDAQLIVYGYRKWGKLCLQHFVGDFSFVLFDPRSKEIFAARDQIGVRPFYFAQTDRYLIVTSSARLFHVLDDFQLNPCERWMALYVLFMQAGFDETPWPEVKKLAPAHYLSFTTDRALSIKKYFDFVDDAPAVYHRSQRNVDAYRAQLEEAVKCRLRTGFGIGSETSGGLDSSTVTGLAAMLGDATVNPYHTFGFARREKEPEYLLKTSQYHRIRNNHVYVDIGTEEDKREYITRSISLLGYPPEDTNSTQHEPFLVDCERLGIRTLLSGFGGDECVTNPGRLLLAELFDKRKFRLLFDNVGGSFYSRPLRFLRSIHHNLKQNDETVALQNKRRMWEYMLVQGGIARRFNLQSSFIDSALFDSPYRAINAFVLNGAFTPHVSNRLECCSLVAAGRKVEYRWPLLDIRLIQQYLSTPSVEKFHRATSRYLHRQALEGVVPDAVRWKQSKDMGRLAFAETRKSAIAELDLASEFSRLVDQMHPACGAIFDKNHLITAIPKFRKLNKENSPLVWQAYRMQLRAFQTLNEWLVSHH